MRKYKISSNRILSKRKYRSTIRRSVKRLEKRPIVEGIPIDKISKKKQEKINKFKDYKKYKIYKERQKQKNYKTLASIPARVEVDAIIGIVLPNGKVFKKSVRGKASSNNIKKNIQKTMKSALQNAMYVAVSKIGTSGVGSFVESVLGYDIYYPKEFRLKRSKRGYTQVYVDNEYYLNEKTSYVDFDTGRVSFDASRVSEQTLDRRELEQDSYDYDGWGYQWLNKQEKFI